MTLLREAGLSLSVVLKGRMNTRAVNEAWRSPGLDSMAEEGFPEPPGSVLAESGSGVFFGADSTTSPYDSWTRPSFNSPRPSCASPLLSAPRPPVAAARAPLRAPKTAIRTIRHHTDVSLSTFGPSQHYAPARSFAQHNRRPHTRSVNSSVAFASHGSPHAAGMSVAPLGPWWPCTRTYRELTAAPDRTSKGIGVFNAAPLYEALPGFERSVASLHVPRHALICITVPKATSGASATRRTAGISPGHRLSSMLHLPHDFP